jgi:hypothetical protein
MEANPKSLRRNAYSWRSLATGTRASSLLLIAKIQKARANATKSRSLQLAPEPQKKQFRDRAAHRHGTVAEAQHRLLQVPDQTRQQERSTHARGARAHKGRTDSWSITKSAKARTSLTAKQANDRRLHRSHLVLRSQDSRMRVAAPTALVSPHREETSVAMVSDPSDNRMHRRSI